jgi:protein-L-isoaspartate(D-aspartate) O-methyltransferase
VGTAKSFPESDGADRDRLAAGAADEVAEGAAAGSAPGAPDRVAADAADRVELAVAAVPRTRFLPAELRELAGQDHPLPIGLGQTSSQPTTVRDMLTLLDVRAGHRVLDVGAGSGWTTALLAHLAGPGGRVIGVERYAPLLGPAREALAGASGSAARAEIRHARPGVLGAPEDGPFDRILVSAGADRLPSALTAQLADGGVMVIPVRERMLRVVRRGEDLQVTRHGAYVFVPLVEDPSE